MAISLSKLCVVTLILCSVTSPTFCFSPVNRNIIRFSSNVNECSSPTIVYSKFSSSSARGTEHLELAPSTKQLSNLSRRWITGLSLGAVASVIVSSGSAVFAAALVAITLGCVGEYSAIVQATGITLPSKTAAVSTVLTTLVALIYPKYHELSLPAATVLINLSFLLCNGELPSIHQISATMYGMLYAGYLPSFWVRLQSLSTIEYNTLWSLYKANILNPWRWSFGTCCVWWTWLAIVCADVVAYFVGKKFGRTKLSIVGSAIGKSSPRKTIEGAIGGFAASIAVATLGAKVMVWPKWCLNGPIYGLLVGVIGLVGDLTESVMKRDAGIKDSGTVLPGHGGILDRFDSYILTAPLAFCYCREIMDSLKGSTIS